MYGTLYPYSGYIYTGTPKFFSKGFPLPAQYIRLPADDHRPGKTFQTIYARPKRMGI